MSKVSPTVYFYHGFDDFGQPLVEKKILKTKVLHDVDLQLLDFVTKRWIRRVHEESPTQENTLQQPTLIFPLAPNFEYKGTIALCRLNNSRIGLSKIEKLAVKMAFKFRAPTAASHHLASKKSLEVIADQTVQAILSRDVEGFKEAFKNLQEFHLLFLQIGELKDNEQAINYAVVESSWFGSLHSEWSRIYRDIFEAAVKALDNDEAFFDTCCYNAYRIIPGILETASKTGLDSILQMQSYLWFRLNEWWESNCGLQSLTHYNSEPAELRQPQNKLHKEALKTFIEGWENLHRFVLTRNAEKNESWTNYSKLMPAYNEHLKSTILFLAKSVLTGNKDACIYWTDYIIRWNANSQPMSQPHGYHVISDAQKAAISPALLSLSWTEVESILKKFARFEGQPIEPNVVFSYVLQNYWQDCCTLLVSFLVNWTMQNENHVKPLSAIVIQQLLSGDTSDEGDVHGKTKFLDSLSDYFTAYFRRHAYHEWSRDKYPGWLESIVRNLNGLTEKERMSGRIYSSSGSAFDSIYESELLVGLLVEQTDTNTHDNFKKRFGHLLEEELIASNLESHVSERLKNVESVNPESIARLYNIIFSDSGAQIFDAENIGQDLNLQRDANNLTLANQRITTTRTAFAALLDVIKNSRLEKIKRTPVSKAKLQVMAEQASATAFNVDTAAFPVCLFQSDELVSKSLKPFKLTSSNYPKSSITEEKMDNVHYSNDWHHDAVSSRLYPFLVLDIFEEAKKRKKLIEVRVRNEEEYAAKLIEISSRFEKNGLHPIMIVETFQSPKWFYDWESASWRTDKVLPDGITIQNLERRQKGGYITNVNNMPVYNGHAQTGGSLIIPTEMLSKVKFKKMDNGLPVEVRFEESADDPWNGVLSYHWERAVELNSKYQMYLLRYPKSSGEEAEEDKPPSKVEKKASRAKREAQRKRHGVISGGTSKRVRKSH